MRKFRVVIFGFAAAAFLFASGNKTGEDRKYENWKAVLVRADEPGEPMIVTGVVYDSDGEKPLAGIKVHIYHTDARGYYSIDGKDESQHRLNATMVTNAEGKYEYRTIKPASYPSSRVPSHVHYVVSGERIAEQRFELQFQGDRHHPERALQDDAKRSKFSYIRPLVKDAEGVLHCEFNIKIQQK